MKTIKKMSTPELFKAIKLGLGEPRSLGEYFMSEDALLELARRQRPSHIADWDAALDEDTFRKTCEEAARGK